jgi:putative membrane protein
MPRLSEKNKSTINTMKTNHFNLLASIGFALLMAASACHGAKDSTTVADSANQKQIASTDSANKAQVKSSDSSLKARTALKEDASKFLVKSYESGMYEVQLSQLAATNSLVAGVKDLAANLVTAHTAVNAKISAIAANANFALPTALNADHQKDLQNIGKLTGTDFDKKYINTIIDGHEKSIDSYKDAAKNLTPSDTKTFASETLPHLEEHLAMAKKGKDGLK